MQKTLDVEIIRGFDPDQGAEVQAFLDACPHSLAQQSVYWRNVIAPIGPDEPLFLVCRRQGEVAGVLPAYKFDGPLGSVLTSAIQAGALGGVAAAGGHDPEPVYASLLSAFVNLASENGCATATIITHPFRPDDRLCADLIRPDYVLQNQCQVLDLDTAIDRHGNITGISDNVRRNLKKAHASELCIDERQTVENVDAWYQLHSERHQEIGATPLPRAMFTGALREMVPREKARFFFIRLKDPSGEMIAGGFYVYHGQVIDALMPSVRTKYRHLAANFLLADHTIRWASSHGLKYYNWQASPPQGGVASFKRQWGSRDAAYCFLTRITGDIGPFVASTADDVREMYRGHYVLPFDQVGKPRASGLQHSSRETAWKA